MANKEVIIMPYNKRFDKRKKEDTNGLQEFKFEDSGKPTKDKEGTTSSTLNARTLRDLRFRPLTVKANPDVEASIAAVPYAILNSRNGIIDASYPGKDTLSGNTIQQLLNNTRTKLLNEFDTGRLSLRLNYLYLGIKSTDKNQALNRQMGSSIDESLSFGYSEQLTQLPFYTSTYSSSMPSSDSKNVLPALVWYQTALLNTASIPSKYLQTMSLFQNVVNMGFNREAPYYHDLFGKLRKSAFVAVINGISNYTAGEYFDHFWFKQMNTLCNVPSRASDSMSDPLLTICAVHKMPDLTITSNGASTPYFNSENYKTTINGVTYTLEDLALAINEALDVNSIIAWARQKFEGKTNVTSTDYFNNIVDLLEGYKSLMVKFSSDMSDVRTFMDLMNKSGLNSWTRGIYFKVSPKVMQYKLCNNILCSNVFASYLGSANQMVYDESTFRWKYFSMWNRYYGIPAYDMRDGGSFLTFSVRDLPEDTDYTGTRWLIPKLFDVIPGSVRFVSRVGLIINMEYQIFDNSRLNSDPILSRLNPLSVQDLSIRMPAGSVLAAGNIPSAASSMYKLISNVFGFGLVEVADGQFDTCLSADEVCFVDVEMDDISNAMISFSRAFAPFRVATADTDLTVGFLTMKGNLA